VKYDIFAKNSVPTMCLIARIFRSTSAKNVVLFPKASTEAIMQNSWGYALLENCRYSCENLKKIPSRKIRLVLADITQHNSGFSLYWKM